MRTLVIFALSLTVLLPGFSQTAASPGASLPKEPHEILAAAAPHYDFSSPDLKPWRMKVSYQFYDMKGRPAEQGTWEYWWASRKVSRSSWTRGGVEHTTWSTADGARYRKESGGPLRYFERTMEPTLLSPLPERGVLDSGKMKLDLKMLPADKPVVACVLTTPQRLVNGELQVSNGVANHYCFDPATLVLRESYSNQLTTQYSQIVKVQGRYLAQQVVVTEDKRKLFTASVETIDVLNAGDVALAPPADATMEKPAQSLHGDGESGVTAGALVRKQYPIYPAVAKMAHEQGVVVLAATIGTDGKIHDVEVVATPSHLLTESAVECVKTWEYKPYLLNGVPVEVETLVNVMYMMSR